MSTSKSNLSNFLYLECWSMHRLFSLLLWQDYPLANWGRASVTRCDTAMQLSLKAFTPCCSALFCKVKRPFLTVPLVHPSPISLEL